MSGLRRSSRAAAKRVLPDYVGDQAPPVAAKKPRPTKSAKAAGASATPSVSADGGGTTSKPKKAATAAAPPKKAKKAAGARSGGKGEAASAAGDEPVAEADGGLAEGDVLPDDLPEIQKHTGETTTLGALVAAAEKGIVIFAYPKASTPGCTTQACSFRDNYSTFKTAGYAVYGLSGDSPSANEKFSTKQSLGDIILLCDPKYELHARLQIKKSPKGTIRSVIVIGKKDDKSAVILGKGPANPAQSVAIAQKAAGISANPAVGSASA